MSDVKISELPAATSVNGSDVLPIVQSGTTKKATISLIGGGLSSVAALHLTSSGDSGNIAAHPYTLLNTGIYVTDANGVEVFRIWGSDPDPSFTNFNTWNLYLGYQAGFSQPSDNTSAGYSNIGIGHKSLFSITTGIGNISAGNETLLLNNTGSNNTAIGHSALISNTAGNYNLAIGNSALQSSDSPAGDVGNVGIGAFALQFNVTGIYNTAVGADSLSNNTGSYNTAIGRSTGSGSIGDSSMVFIGRAADHVNGGTLTNGIAIGASAQVEASNTAVIGNNLVTDVYFGSTAGNAKLHADGSLLTNLPGGTVVFSNPGGRLTTESGVPVSTSDRTAQGTLYYTPYLHNNIYTWNGSAWQAKTFSQISLALTVTSGKNYDVFIDSGATTLSLSAAWTNDTTRANALGTQDGVTVLGSDHTKLWLGTIRADGTNTTADSAGGTTTQVGGKRFVWNNYNRVTRAIKVIDTTATWSYTTATIRQANNASGNKVEYVTGDIALNVNCEIKSTVLVRTQSSTAGGVGIGIDSTTTLTGINAMGYNENGSSIEQPISARYSGSPGLGYHYLSWNETGGDTVCVFIGMTGNFLTGLIAEILN